MMLASFAFPNDDLPKRRGLYLVAPLAMMLAATAAQADIAPAKQAWDDTRRAAGLAGLEIVAESIEQADNHLILQSVTLRLQGARGETGYRLDALRIDPRGDGQVVLTPSDTGQLVLVGTAGAPYRLMLDHVGTVLFTLDESAEDGAELDVSPSFSRFSITDPGDPAARDRGQDWQAFTVAGGALSGTISLSLGSETGLSVTMQAEPLEYRFEQQQTGFLAMQQHSRGAVGLITLSARMDRQDLLTATPAPSLAEAFEQGFRAALSLEVQDSTSHSRQEGPFMDLTVSGSGRGGALTLNLMDGVFDFAAQGDGLGMTAQVEDMTVDLSMDHYGAEIRLPLIPGAATDRVGLDLAMRGIALAPETLSFMGLETMQGESADLELALSVGAQVLGDLLDPDAMRDMLEGDGARSPLALSDLSLDTLLARIGDTRLQGEGRITVPEGAPVAEDMLDAASGALAFELTGGEALLTRLGDAGLIAPDQMLAARMVLGLMGRNIGADRYRSEIDIAPGGRLTVNGLPLPF